VSASVAAGKSADPTAADKLSHAHPTEALDIAWRMAQ
jgi:hypothetical protein